jgi:hypothetical protein
METDGIVDDCNRVSSPEDLRTAVGMVKPGVVECFLVTPRPRPASTSFVSLLSLCLIDHPKQNDADFVEQHGNSVHLHNSLNTYAAQLDLETTLLD